MHTGILTSNTICRTYQIINISIPKRSSTYVVATWNLTYTVLFMHAMGRMQLNHTIAAMFNHSPASIEPFFCLSAENFD